jgi:hypothetical protein
MRSSLPRVLILTAALCLLLGGCQSWRTPKAPPVEPVLIPKDEPLTSIPRLPPPVAPAPAPQSPKSCVPRSLAPAPRYPDSDTTLRSAPGAADRYQMMAAGRLLRQQRLNELERVIAGCR